MTDTEAPADPLTAHEPKPLSKSIAAKPPSLPPAAAGAAPAAEEGVGGLPAEGGMPPVAAEQVTIDGAGPAAAGGDAADEQIDAGSGKLAVQAVEEMEVDAAAAQANDEAATDMTAATAEAGSNEVTTTVDGGLQPE